MGPVCQLTPSCINSRTPGTRHHPKRIVIDSLMILHSSLEMLTVCQCVVVLRRFDFAEFAMAAGIEPVMTTTSTTTPQSFAELVECATLHLSQNDSGECSAESNACDSGTVGATLAHQWAQSEKRTVTHFHIASSSLSWGTRVRTLYGSGCSVRIQPTMRLI